MFSQIFTHGSILSKNHPLTMSRAGRDFGSKTGGGAPASASQAGVDRKERLRKLADEIMDISKDPYILRTRVGTYECKLCLTLHPSEANYISHTQGRKHQDNLGKRAAKEAAFKAKQATANPGRRGEDAPRTRKNLPKLGKPGYAVTRQFDATTRQRSLLFQIDYPEILVRISFQRDLGYLRLPNRSLADINFLLFCFLTG